MDRDGHWDSIEKAYNLFVLGQGKKEKSALEAIQKSYSANITDEFVEPTLIDDGKGELGTIKEKDSVIFFNFREDRARQLTKAFVLPTFTKFKRENYLSDIDIVIIGAPNEDELVKKLDKLEEKLQRDINYKLYTLNEFKKDVRESEPFVLEVLKDKKIMIIGDEDALRKISKG